MPLKCCTQYVNKFGKHGSYHRIGKGKFTKRLFSKKSNAKEHSNYCTVVLISHVNKVMLKIFQTSKRFSRLWTEKFQMYKLGLERAEEQEIKFPTFIGSQRKQESSRKTSTSTSLTMLKPLTVWITTNCGKFLRRREYQTTFPVSW